MRIIKTYGRLCIQNWVGGTNMEYGYAEFLQIMDNFKAGQDALADVSVSIKGGENELDPLTLLRAYQGEKTLDNNLALAAKFLLNKEVAFYKEGREIHHFVYGGGDLANKFTGKPWLLDTLLGMTYGLLLKKLTPPSEDLEKEENG